MENLDLNQIVEIVVGVSFVAAHLIAIFGTPKFLPSPVLQIIQLLAANYNKAKNLPVEPKDKV